MGKMGAVLAAKKELGYGQSGSQSAKKTEGRSGTHERGGVRGLVTPRRAVNRASRRVGDSRGKSRACFAVPRLPNTSVALATTPRARIPKTSFHFQKMPDTRGSEAGQAGSFAAGVARAGSAPSFGERETSGGARFACPVTPEKRGGAGCVPSSRALDAEAQLQRDVLRAIACVGDKHKTTLPELYLAYTLEFGEELRDALLRVAKEPVNNPKKRTIMDLVEKTKLAEVVEVTRGPAGRFGEAVFFVERRGGKRIKRSDFPTRDRTGTATFATLQHTTRTPVQRPATETHTEKHHRVLSPKPLRKTPSALFLETPGETITPPAFESSHSLSCFTLRGEAICRNQNRSNECQYRW